MADVADIADEWYMAEHAVRVAKSQRPVGPRPKGACHYCDEPIKEGLIFCDADCRDDHAALAKRLAIGGVR